jgi:hypothetical protein
VTLHPGTYQNKLQGSIVFFTDAAGKSYSTITRVVKLSDKAAGTAIMGENEGGNYHVLAMSVHGLDVKLVF